MLPASNIPRRNRATAQRTAPRHNKPQTRGLSAQKGTARPGHGSCRLPKLRGTRSRAVCSAHPLRRSRPSAKRPGPNAARHPLPRRRRCRAAGRRPPRAVVRHRPLHPPRPDRDARPAAHVGLCRCRRKGCLVLTRRRRCRHDGYRPQPLPLCTARCTRSMRRSSWAAASAQATSSPASSGAMSTSFL